MSRYAHDLGRVALGLGLVFLALSVIRNAVAPLQDMQGMSTVIHAIGSDPVNAALAGLALTLLMHSSLAALLTAVALVSHTALDPVSGLGFVLGANIGSALLPLWLLRSESAASLTVPRILAVFRSAFAVLFLMLSALLRDPIVGLLGALATHSIMLFGHIGFNLILLILSPLATPISAFFDRDPRHTAMDRLFEVQGDDISPEIAIAAIKREINLMLEQLARMLDTVTSDSPDEEALAQDEEATNSALTTIRNMLTRLPDYPEPTATHMNALVDFAIRIERCADILSGKYRKIRADEAKGGFSLTPSGAKDIENQVAQLRKTLLLAQSVFWTEDPNQAGILVECKQEMAQMEEESRRAHLHLVQIGDMVAISSSNQHLEMIAALKEINSKLATIGYAVLDKHGVLRKSRVKSGRMKSLTQETG
ncbi:MAG: hypothetical protein P8X66_10130 [Maritimibacter sp.]